MSTRVLIIEDDQMLGDILLHKLKAVGYDSLLVSDGKEGLEAIREQKPSLVLLDILLPSMNGYEILEAKQADSSIAEIPVIIISNSGQPVELQRTLELGARDYFIKAQLDPDDIVSKVRTLIPLASEGSNQVVVGKKILLVEDDGFLSDVLYKKLTLEQCVVFKADTGEKAIEIAEREVPHVILLDLVLPGLSGFEALERLGAIAALKDTRIIVLSNLSQQDDMDKAKELGADLFMVKASSTPSEIFSTIRGLLGSSVR